MKSYFRNGRRAAGFIYRRLIREILTYFLLESITVQLSSSFAGLDSTEQVNMLLILA